MSSDLVNQFFLVLLCTQLVRCDLVVEPSLLVSEVHRDVSFLCSMDSRPLSVNWKLPSGEVLLANGSSTNNRFENFNGTLSISNVSITDSGEYECSMDDNTTSVGVLKIFIMPSYTLDLSLICGLNVLLIILFIISNVFNHIRYKITHSMTDLRAAPVKL